MKIAIVSDIHAYPAALEAALKDAREQGAARFVCLGRGWRMSRRCPKSDYNDRQLQKSATNPKGLSSPSRRIKLDEERVTTRTCSF